MCVFFISSTAMFFAFAIIEYKKFRRPGNFFFPRGKKISWSALASAWEDFLLFWGGARRLMRRPAPTMLFLFAFVIRHGFVSFVIRKLVCKSDGHHQRHTVNQGIGSKEVNEKSSTYHAVSICILLLDTLCVRNYVNLLLGRRAQSTC